MTKERIKLKLGVKEPNNSAVLYQILIAVINIKYYKHQNEKYYLQKIYKIYGTYIFKK